MKLKHINIVACASVVALFSTGCEDYLTTINPNQVQQTDYYSNLNETESGLNAVYYSSLDQYIWNSHCEANRADLGYPGFGRPVSTSAENYIWSWHEYNNSTNDIALKWGGLYEGIFRANQVMQGLNALKDGGSIDSESEIQLWNEQMAQATFFRGLFHHYLWISFRHSNGKCAIIRDRTPATQEEYYKDLSTPEEVRDFARTDLKKAYEMLPAKWDGVNTATSGKGRVTAATAATILGTSYLYAGDVDSAAMYYKDVVTNAAYGLALETDYSKINTYAGEFNQESIFEISYSIAHKTEEHVWSDLAVSNRLSKFFHGYALAPSWMAVDYSTEKIDPLDARNYYNEVAPTGVTKKLRIVPNRCSASVIVMDDIHTQYYDEACTTNGYGVSPDGYGWCTFRHNTNWDDAEANKADWMSGKNYIVHKLSEVYINYAECLAKQGNITEALSYINKVRARWALELIGPSNGDASHTYDEQVYDLDALMKHIMYVEKPLEMGPQGYEARWADLRRWGVIEDRFDDLASRVYYNNEFNYDADLYTEDGFKVPAKTGAAILRATKDAAAVQRYAAANGGADWYEKNPLFVVDYEFDKIASQIKEVDGNVYGYYYPIPNKELITNPAISK